MLSPDQYGVHAPEELPRVGDALLRHRDDDLRRMDVHVLAELRETARVHRPDRVPFAEHD